MCGVQTTASRRYILESRTCTRPVSQSFLKGGSKIKSGAKRRRKKCLINYSWWVWVNYYVIITALSLCNQAIKGLGTMDNIDYVYVVYIIHVGTELSRTIFADQNSWFRSQTFLQATCMWLPCSSCMMACTCMPSVTIPLHGWMIVPSTDAVSLKRDGLAVKSHSIVFET